jgi:ABC-type Na+ transport system ATPase subunit NatA
MSAASTLAIEASGLEKSFGTSRAVCGVDLAVRRGSVYGILGPNGAGKTTTIKMLATLVRPDAGAAGVLGHDIVRDADAVRGAISLTGQLASVDEDLTGEENLILVGRLLGLRRSRAKARAAELLEAFDLVDPAGRLVKGYSGGMRRRLDIAASIIVTPELMFLDEPTTGLDPRSRNQVWDIVRALAAGGTTILLCTGRGRPACRRYRGHRPRPRDRGGHPGPAEVLGRLGRAPRPPARCRPASGRCRHPLSDSRGRRAPEAGRGGAVGSKCGRRPGRRGCW